MSNIADTSIQEMDERIELFLRGEMSIEEEARFREELKTNSELREHARVISTLLKGLHEQGRLHDQEIIDEVKTRQRPNNIRRLALWVGSIAAALVLYLGYSYHAEYSEYARINEMLSPYYTYYDVDDLSRGDVDYASLAHLYSLFNRIPEEKDMTDIIAELEPIYQSLKSDYTYYPYANDVAWNLALAYVKAGEEDKAKAILHDLRSSNLGYPIADKAEELMEALNSR